MAISELSSQMKNMSRACGDWGEASVAEYCIVNDTPDAAYNRGG